MSELDAGAHPDTASTTVIVIAVAAAKVLRMFRIAMRRSSRAMLVNFTSLGRVKCFSSEMSIVFGRSGRPEATEPTPSIVDPRAAEDPPCWDYR